MCSEPEKATKPEWHQISPLRFVGDPEAAWEKLRSFVQAQPRAHLVLEEGRYMHVTFTSFFFRFVDDVEFKLEGDVIHIRSASRLGYSDFNVNRRRMEEIRQGLGW